MFLERQQIAHTFFYTEAVTYVVSNTKYNMVVCTKTLETSRRLTKK